MFPIYVVRNRVSGEVRYTSAPSDDAMDDVEEVAGYAWSWSALQAWPECNATPKGPPTLNPMSAGPRRKGEPEPPMEVAKTSLTSRSVDLARRSRCREVSPGPCQADHPARGALTTSTEPWHGTRRKDEGGRPRFIGLLTTPWRVLPSPSSSARSLLTAWSVSTPLFGPSDEETHIANAVALVHGQLIGGTVKNDKDPYTKIQVPEVYADIYAPCFAFTGTSASCESYSVPHPHRVVPTETYVGRYPPMYYAIVGLPSLIVTSTTGMYLMRTVSSLLGALFLALAIMSVFCWSSRRLLQIGVLLAATPTAAYYASSVNPNGLEIMAAICLWCSGIILVSERSEESTTRPDRSGCGLSDRSDADEKPVPLMGSGDPCVVGGARLPPLAVSAVEKARRPTMDAPLHPLWGVRRRMGSCRGTDSTCSPTQPAPSRPTDNSFISTPSPLDSRPCSWRSR